MKTALGYKPPNYEEKDETVTDHVIVTIEWKLPNPDNRVEWTLWSTSLDTRSRQFKINFASTAIELQKHKHVYYEPHYITWICRNCYPFDDSVHTTLCTHNGKYCAPDPDDDLEHGISGQDIVNENLRQICIFRNTNETEDYKKFWDYVQNFASDCTPDETDVGNTGKFNEECSISVQKKVGLDPAKTKNCIEASECREANQKIHLHNKEFICSSNNENVLLRQEQEQQGVDRIFILPTMIINGEQYRGDLARSSVLRAICAGFVPGTKPSTCFSPRVGGLQYVVKGAGFNNVNGIYTQISEDDVQLTSFVGTDKTNKENNYFVIRFHDGQWKIEDGSDVYYFNKNEAEFPPESGWQPGEKAKNTVAPKVHTYVPEKDKEVVHKESNQTTMIIVVIAVVVIAIASVLFYRRRLRSEMRQEVRSILAEYMPLTDVDSEEYRKGSSQLI